MLEAEKQLVSQAKEGDKEAFSQLYDHYFSKIYRYVLFRVSGQEEAEDLTHEVFLSAWKNMPRYKEKGFPFSSWLYSIARNSVIDSYRTNKKTIQIELASEEFIKVESTDETSLDNTLEFEKVKNAIGLLKPQYQEILILRFIEEMSHGEIASATGKSEGAIRLMQHRALKELKSLYDERNRTASSEA